MQAAQVWCRFWKQLEVITGQVGFIQLRSLLSRFDALRATKGSTIVRRTKKNKQVASMSMSFNPEMLTFAANVVFSKI